MVFKRGKYYVYRFLFAGKMIQKSTHQQNKEEAKNIESAERTRLSLVDAGLQAPVSPITKKQYLTVGDFLDALESDYKLRGKLDVKNASNFKRCRADFGKLSARAITAEDIDAYIAKRVADKKGPKGEIIPGDRPATVNRTTQVLGQALKLAVERHHLLRVPKIRRLSEADNARQGFFSDSEFDKVLSHLPDDGLADFVSFAYATGWRRGECASLTWANVNDGFIRLRGEDAKNGEGRCVPIEGELVTIIERRKKARCVDGTLTSVLFHRGDGRPIVEFRKSWAGACEKAGVHHLFHDLRRSAIRNLVRSGVSEKVAMSISGHKTRSVFDRYNITSETDLRDAMRRVQEYHAGGAQ